MSPPEEKTPTQTRRFGRHGGCYVVVLLLGALAGSVVLAIRQPLLGCPLVAAVVALGFWLMRLAVKREREDAAREVARLRAVALPEGAAWRVLLEHEGLGRLVEGLASRVRPAVRVTTSPLDGAPVVGRSRVGGTPDLPPDLPWPEHAGVPMMFLAQLDLAEIPRGLGGLLPETGHLWFFYSLAEPWGFDPKDAGGSRVFHRPNGTSLVRATAPEKLPAEARFKPCAVSFAAYEDLPELDEHPGFQALDDDESERYIDLRSYVASGGDGPSHKLLGHADPVQYPMELECQLVTNGINCGSPSGYEDPRADALKAGQADWRLLLQLDSDERPGMMWGDAGRLYFWMREADLRGRRFDEAWLILQCH